MTPSRRLLQSALVAVTLVSCTTPAGDSPAPAAAERPRVALVMKSLANEFFKTMEDGARTHQAANAEAYDLLATGIKDEQDVGGQIRLIEQMVAEGADALVIAPADSKALISACQKAQRAGVVVVNIDNRLDAGILAERGLEIPFVGPDNAKGAHQVGEHLAAKLEPGDQVAILSNGGFGGIHERLLEALGGR